MKLDQTFWIVKNARDGSVFSETKAAGADRPALYPSLAAAKRAIMARTGRYGTNSRYGTNNGYYKDNPDYIPGLNHRDCGYTYWVKHGPKQLWVRETEPVWFPHEVKISIVGE